MAEYYPLLSKAVSGLRDGPTEKRQAIYARARQALVGQLQSMEQANPELIDRETRALDDAIGQVEAEIAKAVSGAEPAAAPGRPVPPPRPAVPPAPPGRDRPASPRPFALPPRPSPVQRPVPAAPSPAEPATVPRPTRGVQDRAVSPPLPVAPRLQVREADTAALPSAAEPAAASVRPERPITPFPGQRDEAVRPVAPRQPVAKERVSARSLVVALVAALVVAGIGYAAWRLRDRPEAIARARAALQASHQADEQPGKVSNRADGGAGPPTIEPDRPSNGAPAAPRTDPTPAPATAQPASPATQPPVSLPEPTAATTPAPATAAPDASNPPTNSVPDTPAAAPAPSAPSVAVSQRAAFLVDAPDQDPKVKTYVGTVVWTTESVSPGQGQPLATAVRAEVDVPDANLKLSMLMQKNVEAQFPASHTIELRFTPAPGNTLGNVTRINVPQMRKDDTPSGDGLTGLPVTITDNYFLVGLTRGDVISRNLDLLQSRNWIDIPCTLASGKVAKITFEKGITGDKLVAEAIQSWQ